MKLETIYKTTKLKRWNETSAFILNLFYYGPQREIYFMVDYIYTNTHTHNRNKKCHETLSLCDTM